jgi:hypothetical protein
MKVKSLLTGELSNESGDLPENWQDDYNKTIDQAKKNIAPDSAAASSATEAKSSALKRF